ncbi:MAG TPA: hypothetical protein DC024_13875 [Clostridiales bacterium]|jgi:dCTP deaminase|nr:hypothetical protein [Clostridiales bacterium]
MILTGKELVNRVKNEKIFGDTLDWRCFTGWQFDLKLGEQAFISDDSKPIILGENGYLVIEPGTFALLETEEHINMPQDLMGFIAVRFSFKKLGLVNISGFHVDPGYKGKLIFSVYNAGPNDILMQRNRPVFMIFFANLISDMIEFMNQITNNPKEFALNQTELKVIESRRDTIIRDSGYSGIPIDMMTAIQGNSVSLSRNTNRIEKLENNFKIFGAIALTVIGALITILFTLLGKLANGS